MEQLRRRGKGIEALFGFRVGGTLALIPTSGLVFTEVALEPDADGAVRCRFGGLPATLLPVTDALWLDVAKLAATLPALASELVRRTDAATARALLASSPWLEPFDADRLRDTIVEHQIHASNLHLLGDAPPALTPLGAQARFAMRLPSGLLELTYTDDAYRAAHDTSGNPFAVRALDVAARWEGAPVELFRALAWNDAELAELAVVAHAALGDRPGSVLSLFEAAFDAEKKVLRQDGHPADLRATLLNFWGVALRRTGRLDEAVDTLTRALPIAIAASPALEQEVVYNRGYARLETTMKSRSGRDGVGLALFTSHFAIAERHRATWQACLSDFERAHTLDPKDPSATSQIGLTKKLLALLAQGPTAATAPASRKTPAPSAKQPESSLGNWIGPIVVVAAIIFLVVVFRRPPRDETPHPIAAAPSAPAAPTARELSEQARAALFAGSDRSALLREPTGVACPFALAPPPEVPEGEVVGPQLARGIGTGELYGTDYFDATVRNYLRQYASYADVLALDPSAGPLHDTQIAGPDVWTPRAPFRLTILVTGWRDPVILEGGASMLPGEARAHLLLWSYEEARLVCATREVAAENRQGLRIVRARYDALTDPEDDPLNRARVDLIEQVLRSGLSSLAALDVP